MCSTRGQGVSRAAGAHRARVAPTDGRVEHRDDERSRDRWGEAHRDGPDRAHGDRPLRLAGASQAVRAGEQGRRRHRQPPGDGALLGKGRARDGRRAAQELRYTRTYPCPRSIQSTCPRPSPPVPPRACVRSPASPMPRAARSMSTRGPSSSGGSSRTWLTAVRSYQRALFHGFRASTCRMLHRAGWHALSRCA